MKTYETKPHTYDRKLCIETKCDLCGAKEGTPEWVDPWNAIDFNETDIQVTVKQKEGWHTSDGGSGTEYIVDMCPKCFKDRLIPWIRSQGGHVEEKEWDW